MRTALLSGPVRLLEMSNFYCHPGRAGGFPIIIKNLVPGNYIPSSMSYFGGNPHLRETGCR
jgi:hypothetical protein